MLLEKTLNSNKTYKKRLLKIIKGGCHGKKHAFLNAFLKSLDRVLLIVLFLHFSLPAFLQK